MAEVKETTPVRCSWCGTDPIYIDYHDNEWGKEVFDDRVLFEFLILESAQAGLSWITILKRREGYRKAFKDFDPVKVAAMKEKDVERLMLDESIIRNRLKIKSAIRNARIFLHIQEQYGSFRNYLLGFMPGNKRIVNHIRDISEIRATSPESDAISKDLKKKGITFFGSTICYAYLQAVGLVDDHIESCHCRCLPAHG